MSLHIVDVSEWQGNVDWTAYGSARPAGIARASVGTRADLTWPGRRDAMRGALRVRGWYHYLTGADPVRQAQTFAAAIGALQPGEFAVCDVEEPTLTDPAGAAVRFCAETDRLLGTTTWVYSGESYWNARLSGTQELRKRPLWVAAYRSTEPTIPHVMWQHTATSTEHPGMPGPVDCSTFAGTIDDLIALTGGTIDVPITPAEIDAIANKVVEKVASDTTHPYTVAATGAAIQAEIADLGKRVDRIAAGGVDPAAVAELVIAALGDRLQAPKPPKP